MKITLDNNLEFLYQWDINRYIILEGIEAGTILQFTNTDLDNALSVESTNKENKIICNIPNILLTYNKDITIFVWDGEKVVFSKKIKLISRNKPDDYIYEETEIITISNLKKEIKELNINKADNLELINNNLLLKSNDKILSNIELIIDSFNLDDGNLIDIKTFFTEEDLLEWLGEELINEPNNILYQIQETIPENKYYIINYINFGIYIITNNSLYYIGEEIIDDFLNRIELQTERINNLYNRLNNVVFTNDILILDGGTA